MSWSRTSRRSPNATPSRWVRIPGAARSAAKPSSARATAAIPPSRPKTQLVIDREPEPAFLIYQALYSYGLLPASLEERREQLSGFVGTSVRYSELLAELLPAGESDLLVQLYDGSVAQASPDTLAYSSPLPAEGLITDCP